MNKDINTVDMNTAQLQIKELSQKVKDLIQLMRSQQQALRQRGMNLPPAALNGLKSLRTRLDKLNQQFTSMQIELTQLRALAENYALITSTLEVDEVLNQVMDTVIQLTGAERGYIVLKNPTTGEMEFRVARGLAQEQTEQSDFIVSRTIVNQVTETREPVLTDNASADSRYQGQESIVSYALRSILAVPLKLREEVVGVVYCDNRILAGLFRQHELNLLTAFADQAAVAIENARLFADARAQLDEITSVRDLMENIFSSVASGIITVSRNGTVAICNSAAENILRSPKGNILGYPIEDVLPGYDDTFMDAMDRVLQEGAQELIELEPELAEVGKRDWNIILSPLRDVNDGSTQGVAIMLDDLTEVKEHEAQLAKVRGLVPFNLDSIRAEDIANISVEVRTITSIFADVRGFTSFSENLQPEDLMRIINRYLSLASDAINLYRGLVDKYMGDAVTGLFNTQLNPQDDHAVLAVRAAMSMIYDLYALHEVLEEDSRLFYGVGIHTGPAVLGNVGGSGRVEFSAIGEAMDISKVLQENAGPGEVIISQETHDIIQDMFECEPLTPKKTKGHDEITVVYKVIKRKKGVNTGPLMLDPDLLDIFNDDD